MQKTYKIFLFFLFCTTVLIIIFSFQKTQQSLPTISPSQNKQNDPKNKDSAIKDDPLHTIISFYEKSPDPSIPVEFFHPKNTTDGSVIPLEQLATYQSFSLPKEIQDIVDSADYSLFRCNMKNESSFGLQMTIAPELPHYPKDPYPAMKEYLQKNNETYIDSLWSILYPQKQKQHVSLSEPYKQDYSSSSDSAIIFNNAVFKSLNNEEFPLYYGLVENYIIFTTSRHCLETVSNKLYDLVP